MQTDWTPSHTTDICRFFLYRYPVWILLWRTSSREVLNRFPQTAHTNGFSPVWIRLWTVNSALSRQQIPHSVHLYLLLWIFICCFKQRGVLKCFSHWLHEYNFPVICICLWRFRLCFIVNHLSHTVHKYGPLICISLWWFRLSFFVYRLSHTVHTYGLGLSSCGCSVKSLPSASIFTWKELSPEHKYGLGSASCGCSVLSLLSASVSSASQKTTISMDAVRMKWGNNQNIT